MPVIEVDGLIKRYNGRTVVDDVTFSVEEGEVFGILGPNGAGKTTIVESIEGLRKPDGGRIRVFGFDPVTEGTEIHQRLGAQLQESRLPDRIKVWEALDLYSSFYRSPAHWPDLLDQLGLADKRGARFKTLSGGQKQRLSIALALVGNPEVAILDELTTGLDPQARVTSRLLDQVRQPAKEALSDRELEVLQLSARGFNNREAAAHLFISEATVKTHLLHIYTKLGVNDRAAAVATAFERGLLPIAEGNR